MSIAKSAYSPALKYTKRELMGMMMLMIHRGHQAFISKIRYMIPSTTPRISRACELRYSNI